MNLPMQRAFRRQSIHPAIGYLQMYHLDQAPPLIFADAILQPLVPIALSVRPTRASESLLQICNLAGPFHALQLRTCL